MDIRSLIPIFDFLPHAIFAVDGQKKVVAWNRAMEAMTGVKREDILGSDDYAYAVPFYGRKRPVLIDLVAGENREEENLYNQVERQGNILYGEAYAPVMNGGAGACLRGVAVPLRDNMGVYLGAIESIHITDCRTVGKGPGEWKEGFDVFFEEAADPAFLFDGHVFTDCNQAAVRITGATRKEQLVGMNPIAMSPDRQCGGRLSHEMWQEHVNTAMGQGSSRFEWMYRSFQGPTLWTEVSLTALPDQGEKTLYMVWRNMGHPNWAGERSGAGFEERLREKEEELHLKSRNLDEINAALRVLLDEREIHKVRIEEKILSNVKDLVSPYIEKLKKCLPDPNQLMYLDIIEANLNEIVSPFLQKMRLQYAHLTPTETGIAHLIKDGKSTKEIAEILHMSSGAINFHRNNIRKKLGLVKKKINLRSHLLSL